jgi:hypothetical protein
MPFVAISDQSHSRHSSAARAFLAHKLPAFVPPQRGCAIVAYFPTQAVHQEGAWPGRRLHRRLDAVARCASAMMGCPGGCVGHQASALAPISAVDAVPAAARRVGPHSRTLGLPRHRAGGWPGNPTRPYAFSLDARRQTRLPSGDAQSRSRPSAFCGTGDRLVRAADASSPAAGYIGTSAGAAPWVGRTPGTAHSREICRRARKQNVIRLHVLTRYDFPAVDCPVQAGGSGNPIVGRDFPGRHGRPTARGESGAVGRYVGTPDGARAVGRC